MKVGIRSDLREVEPTIGWWSLGDSNPLTPCLQIPIKHGVRRTDLWKRETVGDKSPL